MDLSLAEHQLNTFLDRQAAKVSEDRPGQEAANEEAQRWRARDACYEASVRLVNAKAWAEYFGGLALASHDQAARYAEKRDEALALVRELETNKKEKRHEHESKAPSEKPR